MGESAQSQDCCGVRAVACSPAELCGTTFPRRYRSRKEQHESLERYRDELKSELAGVEERLQGLDEK